MDLRLKGLTALVTGGTSGIGASIVRRFGQEGANVAFCSRSPEKVLAMEEELKALKNIDVFSTSLNINDAASFSAWIDSIPSIDIFVANVSAMSQDWRQSFEIDVHATISAIDIVLPKLLKSKSGAITYIGSKVSTYGNSAWPVYSATKACMVHYMKSLSIQLSPKGVRVNTISPGDIFFAGGVWDAIQRNQPDLYDAAINRSLPGRPGTPEEVANTVVFVSSPLSSFTTGSHILVDGGATTHLR